MPRFAPRFQRWSCDYSAPLGGVSEHVSDPRPPGPWAQLFFKEEEEVEEEKGGNVSSKRNGNGKIWGVEGCLFSQMRGGVTYQWEESTWTCSSCDFRFWMSADVSQTQNVSRCHSNFWIARQSKAKWKEARTTVTGSPCVPIILCSFIQIYWWSECGRCCKLARCNRVTEFAKLQPLRRVLILMYGSSLVFQYQDTAGLQLKHAYCAFSHIL